MEQEKPKSKRLYQVWSGSNVRFYLVSISSIILYFPMLLEMDYVNA